MRQQLMELSIEHLYDYCKKKIDEWRDKRHEEINNQHEEMIRQLRQLHNELTEEVEEFKTKKSTELTQEIGEPLTHIVTKQKQIHPDKLAVLEEKLECLQRKITDILNPEIIQMNCDTITLNGEVDFIREHPCNEEEKIMKIGSTLDLNISNQKAAHHFSLKTNSYAVAASNHFVLTYDNASTLHLFNTKNLLRSITISDKNVHDICWSTSLQLFLIAGNMFHTYDAVSNSLIGIPILDSDEPEVVWSVTCYLHDIFLLFKNKIIKHYLLPSFELKEEWPSNKYLEDTDLKASCIRFNGTDILAMSIKQKDTQWRIDVFDMESQRIHRGVALTDKLDTKYFAFQFIPLNNCQWLAMNGTSKPNTILLIDKSGTLKQWTKPGRGVTLMNRKFLVLRDSTGLSFYRL